MRLYSPTEKHEAARTIVRAIDHLFGQHVPLVMWPDGDLDALKLLQYALAEARDGQ